MGAGSGSGSGKGGGGSRGKSNPRQAKDSKEVKKGCWQCGKDHMVMKCPEFEAWKKKNPEHRFAKPVKTQKGGK